MNRFLNESSTSGRRWLGIAALALGIAAGGAMPGIARATPSTPSIPVSSCGSPITSSGFYRVTKNLTAAVNSDCIDIKASNVVLDLHGFTITGLGALVGKGATGVNIFPGKTFVVIEGANNFIGDFDIGIQDQGNYATIEDINTVNNKTVGVLLNGVSYSQVTNTDSFVTSAAGIPDYNPQKYGIEVLNCYLAGVGDGVLEANDIYGLWITQSNATRVWNLFSENNGDTSIYLGCSSNGYDSAGTSCGGKTYGGNLIFDDVTDNEDPLELGVGPTEFGIAVDKSELKDSIFQNSSHGNNASADGDINTPTSFDPNCTKNLYFLNNQEPPGLGHVSPACVQFN